MLGKGDVNPMLPVMASFGSSDKAGPYKGKATFDVFQSGRSGRVFFVVYAQDELVLIHSFANGFEEERHELTGVNLSTARCRANKASMRNIINEALDPEGSPAFLRTFYQKQTDENTERMYRNWCGALMSLVGHEADLPEEPGMLLRLCGRDTKFLRTLAALGSSGSPLIGEDDLEEICKQTGVTAEQFKARAEAVEQEHNLTLLWRSNRYFSLTI